MSKCNECLSEKVCRYNDGINLYCKDDYRCPHFSKMFIRNIASGVERKLKKTQRIFRTNSDTLTLSYSDNVDDLRDLFNLGFKVVMANTWYDDRGRPQGVEYILEVEHNPIRRKEDK